MSPREHFDVVVIGYGLAGATAALTAAQANARVLILHQSVVTSARPPHALRAALRAAAREAGVEVWAPCRVHELITEAGTVSGVGYATMPPRGLAPAAHRWLRRMSVGAPARITTVLADAAEAVWRSAFGVQEISCSSVILAVGPRHWEFVGPAAWSAARAGATRPYEVSAPTAPMPELAVRAWCAARERAAFAGLPQPGLRVDALTGAVLVGEDQPVPGLYAAVDGICGGLVAGRRAGNGAATRMLMADLPVTV